MVISGIVLAIGLVVLIGVSEAYAGHAKIPVFAGVIVDVAFVAFLAALCVLVVNTVRLIRMRGRHAEGELNESEPVAEPAVQPVVEDPAQPATTRPSFRTRMEVDYKGVGELLGYLGGAALVILFLARLWLAAGIVALVVIVLLPLAFFGVEGVVGGVLRVWHHLRWHPPPDSTRTTMLMTPEPGDRGRVLLEPADAAWDGAAGSGSLYVDLEMREKPWRELVIGPSRVPVIVLGDPGPGGVVFIEMGDQVLRPRARAIATMPGDKNPSVRAAEAAEMARQRESQALEASPQPVQDGLDRTEAAPRRPHRIAWLIGAVSCAFFLVFAIMGLVGNIALHQRGTPGLAHVDRLRCDHYRSNGHEHWACDLTLSYRAGGRPYRWSTFMAEDPHTLSYVDASHTTIRILYDRSDPTVVSYDVGSTGGGTTFSLVFFVCLVALLAIGVVVCTMKVVRRRTQRTPAKAEDPVADPL